MSFGINGRRLLALSLVGVYLAIPVVSVKGQETRTGEFDFAAGLSQAKFEDLLNQSFYINSASGVVILDLVEVQGQKKQAEGSVVRAGRATEQFTVIFAGPDQAVLPAAIYRLEHRQAGNADLYLEPVGPERPGHYRARFTLLR